MGHPWPEFRDVIEAIYGADFDPRTIHFAAFTGDPHDKTNTHWFGRRLSSSNTLEFGALPDVNHFLCMGLLDPDTKGRSLGNVVGHVAFWMDDIGTKTPLEKVDAFIADTGLRPVLVVQTSPGNRSYTWSFERPIMEDGGFDAQLVAAVRHGLKVGGWGDPATQEAARYMRSGFGINGKKKYRNDDGSPFKVEILEFDPGAMLTRSGIERFAAAVLGENWRDDVSSGKYLTSAQIAAQSGAGGSNERRASMDDPLVKLAAYVGLDPQPSTRAGVIDCHCPNEAAHTGGDPTGYAIINDGMSYCNHASCQHLTSADFQDMMIALYDDQIAAQMALGLVIENPFGPGLIDAKYGDFVSATGGGFLAAARFEGVSVGQGLDAKQARHEALEQAEELAQRKADKTRQSEEAREALLDALFERFVYVEAGEMFWDRKIGELISPSRLDRDEDVLRVFPLRGGDKRASNLLLNAVGRMQHVQTIAIKPYRADQPVKSDIVVLDGPTGKQLAINTFKPTLIGFRPGIPQKFLDHLDFLFGSQPEVRDYLLEFMAFCVQHPDIKTSVVPLIGGPPGIGKDVGVLEPLFKLLGLHNVKRIDANKLSADFNDYLMAPVVAMGEFSLAGRDGEKAYDRLKDYTSPTPVQATINPKYGKTFSIEVAPKFIATTNNEDALEHVPQNDRRFFICWTQAVRLHGPGQGNGPGTDPYYDDLSRWLTDEANLEVLHHYLMHLPIAVFHPHKIPPRTAARHDTLVASLSGAARFVYELLVDGELSSRKVVTYEEIEARALASDNPSVRQRVYPKALAAGLQAAGCQKIGRVSVDGKRVQLWTGSCVVLGDGKVYQGALTPVDVKGLVSSSGLAVDTLVREREEAAKKLAA